MIIAPNFSTIWISLMAVFGGLIMLISGGEMLVSGAVKLARKLGMSSLLIGLTIVAFGTSLPELFVSLSAAFAGHPDIMIGNVVGSNIANIGLILGISVVLYPLRVNYQKIAPELYLVISASLLLLMIAALGFFYRVFGLLFVGALVAYTVVAYRRAGKKKSPLTSGRLKKSYSLLYVLFLGIAGLCFLSGGSNLFIDGAIDVARYFKVSDLVVGLTLAALGTSLPELATSFSAIRRRQSDILLGNVVGSNFFNLLMVMGCTAGVAPFPFPGTVLARDLPIMLGFTVALVPILKNRRRLSRWQGLLMISAYLAYIVLLAQ